MNIHPIVFELENHMVQDYTEHDGNVPDEIQEYIDLVQGDQRAYLMKYGGPTGIAKHPKYGWAILGAGQGPFVMWMESDELKDILLGS